jgi:hypothetical protein
MIPNVQLPKLHVVDVLSFSRFWNQSFAHEPLITFPIRIQSYSRWTEKGPYASPLNRSPKLLRPGRRRVIASFSASSLKQVSIFIKRLLPDPQAKNC